jgi:hypothetical protein
MKPTRPRYSAASIIIETTTALGHLDTRLVGNLYKVFQKELYNLKTCMNLFRGHLQRFDLS